MSTLILSFYKNLHTRLMTRSVYLFPLLLITQPLSLKVSVRNTTCEPYSASHFRPHWWLSTSKVKNHLRLLHKVFVYILTSTLTRLHLLQYSGPTISPFTVSGLVLQFLPKELLHCDLDPTTESVEIVNVSRRTLFRSSFLY